MTHQVSQRQQRSHEDIYTIGKIGPFRYYAIFDGHGGRMNLTTKHTAYYAAEYLNRFLLVSFSDIDLTNVTLVKKCIIETFTDSDEHMFYNKTENGSCCTCVLIGLGKIYQINLGDSRSIIFREISADISDNRSYSIRHGRRTSSYHWKGWDNFGQSCSRYFSSFSCFRRLRA